jgi:uncharacterized protein (DUF4415 family)
MAKKSSESSRRGKLVSVSAESIFSKPLSKRQRAVLARLAERQAAGDDSQIDFSDIPELTEEQLRKARRAPKVLVAARIDRDVYDWLQEYGEGYSTRINTILRAVMSRRKRSA